MTGDVNRHLPIPGATLEFIPPRMRENGRLGKWEEGQMGIQ
jgi:hypothetical protein